MVKFHGEQPAPQAEPPRETQQSEADRLRRPQPPYPIPPRVLPTTPPGLVAQTLLGARVVK